MICIMKSSLKIVWITKKTFLLSGTFLFFLKQKYILFLETYFFKISKNLITLALWLPRQILKNIDLPQQKPQHLLTAKVNFERWLTKPKDIANAFNKYFKNNSSSTQSTIKFSRNKFHDFLPDIELNFFHKAS